MRILAVGAHPDDLEILCGGTLARYARTFPAELHRRAGGAWNVERPAVASPAEHIQAAMYAAQIDRFLDCLLWGAAPPCTGQHGLLGMRVLEAAYRSADSGQSVAL